MMTQAPLKRPGWRITLGVVLFACLLYIPYAGSYGLWDPWETHYGEVARTMLQRGDYITTYWQDELFKSKPVLTFWLQAAGMSALGVNAEGGASGEMALSTRPEWGMRLPIIFVSILALWAIFLLVSRVTNRRAGVFATLICATCPQYALITRQSITDMPFVGCITVSLCFFLLGLFVKEDEEPASFTIKLGGERELTFSSWHIFSAVFLLIVLPQLIVFTFGIGWQWHRMIRLGGDSRINLMGLDYVLPYLALLGFYIVSIFVTDARKARHVYVHLGWLFAGLAVLAKGLGGVAIPVAVVGVFILILRDWRLMGRLELARGLAVLFLVAAPWHHAMWVRHGQAFWNEYFGHHHFKRAQLGVHGERGPFSYFVHQLGIGMFPWTALVPAALVRWIRSPGPLSTRRGRLILFALVWAGVSFALFSIMETKFHHYALPVIPPLAILLGLWLDDLLDNPRPAATLGIACGLLLLLIIARDLIRDPQHLVVMFIYKYDRIFPYELRFEWPILGLSVLLALAMGAMLVESWRRWAAYALMGGATIFTLWTIDVYLVKLTPHWGQKQLHAIYHKTRRDSSERLIAWQLNWRGENYYSKNQVVVHMQPKDTPKFKTYLTRHKGQRFFVIMEQGRLPTLKSILRGQSKQAADSLQLIGPGAELSHTAQLGYGDGSRVWPDNWIPHFRVEPVKILYRERSRLSKRCRLLKRDLSRRDIPQSARRFKGSRMPDTWWGGHCGKFVEAEREGMLRTCATGSRSDCQAARKTYRKGRRLCRRALARFGSYPYRECFEQYPNNKFLLARFTP